MVGSGSGFRIGKPIGMIKNCPIALCKKRITTCLEILYLKTPDRVLQGDDKDFQTMLEISEFESFENEM